MRCAVASLFTIAALAVTGCTHVDVKGRETFRVAPLRGVTVGPVSVDPSMVDIDAGTDALTDEELKDIAASLPQSLAASFDARAPSKRVGTAHIEKCRLRAGPGKSFIVYEARCKVAIDLDGVVLLEVHGEGLVRVSSALLSSTSTPSVTAAAPRNALLQASDSQRALAAALDAAAQIVVDGALPPREDGPKESVMPREQSAALARSRLAHAKAPADVLASLFDLRSHGTPDDAALVVPFLDNNEPAILTAAIDALGELCAPLTKEKLEPFAAGDDATAQSAKRAIARLDACARLSSGG